MEPKLKILNDNRYAAHQFHLMERFEAGLALTGTEVEPLKHAVSQVDPAGFVVVMPAAEIAAVKVGQRLSFTVTGFGDRHFQGSVARINPVADMGTRAISVYVRVPNPGLELKGGMYARGEISAGPGGSALTVPLDALHEPAGQGPWVLVLADGRLQKRPHRGCARAFLQRL